MSAGDSLTGAVVRRLRERVGLSHAQFSDLLHVSTSTVYRWEVVEDQPIAAEGFPCRALYLLRERVLPEGRPDTDFVAGEIRKGVICGGGLLGLFRLLGAVYSGGAT